MKIFRATWQIDRPSEPQIEILEKREREREREREENTKDCMK